jgi:hypothetical protein
MTHDDLAGIYLTAPEAAFYVRAGSVHGFRQWAKKHGVPRCRYGKALRFLVSDLDRAMRGKSKLSKVA